MFEDSGFQGARVVHPKEFKVFSLDPSLLGPSNPSFRKATKMAEKKGFKVKTFTSELKIFETRRELTTLDDQVNQFIKEQKVKKLISVSDTTTTDNTGASIGLIRVLAYEE